MGHSACVHILLPHPASTSRFHIPPIKTINQKHIHSISCTVCPTPSPICICLFHFVQQRRMCLIGISPPFLLLQIRPHKSVLFLTPTSQPQSVNLLCVINHVQFEKEIYIK